MVNETAEAVRETQPRRTAIVRFPDDRYFEARIGTPIEAYVKEAVGDGPVPVIAALVDGELRELTYLMMKDARVDPVYLSDSEGVRIYRRSLMLLMMAAVAELFPEVEIYVDHTLPFGAYFCEVEGRDPFTEGELAQIEARMREMVEEDLPIERDPIPLDEAVELFEARGEDERVKLMKWRTKDYLSMYCLGDRRDYFHGYMVASTGYLQFFDLQPWPSGFVLRYPRRTRPSELRPMQDYPQLTAVFREYGKWLRLLGVESVSGLNEAIVSGRIREIVLVSEALHEQRVSQIADQIAQRKNGVRLVLIAGPSASGKTTFSKRLSVQLLAHGIHPFPLALDNYFVNREDTPRDEHGEYNFEALEAVDISLLNEHLTALMKGERVQLAHFNFKTGRREAGPVVQLRPDHVILLEGIHGMNPDLVPSIPKEKTFRIYVSALTQLNLDRYNRVPTTDTRLIRRLVRDATYRNYSAEETLNRWESVRRGEKRYIFPYQENADVMFNSALVYDLAVLKSKAEPLLQQIEPDSPRHVEAKRLLTFLRWFEPCDADLIPDNSILREFVGGSILRGYTPFMGHLQRSRIARAATNPDEEA